MDTWEKQEEHGEGKIEARDTKTWTKIDGWKLILGMSITKKRLEDRKVQMKLNRTWNDRNYMSGRIQTWEKEDRREWTIEEGKKRISKRKWVNQDRAVRFPWSWTRRFSRYLHWPRGCYEKQDQGRGSPGPSEEQQPQEPPGAPPL